MKSLRTEVGKACAVLLLGYSSAAHAAYSCSMTTTDLNGVYSSAANLNMSGTLTLNCTRAVGDPANMTYFLELNNGATTGTRRLYRHGGTNVNASRLTHTVSRTGFGGTIWSTGANRVTGTLAFGAATFASASFTYFLRVTTGQTGKTVGIYDDILTFSMRQLTAGPVLATATFTPTASVVSSCFVGQVTTGFTAPGATNPSTLTLNYTSFSATPQTANMSFTVDCTSGTAYTLALTPASGTLLGLPYTLSLSSAGATGTGLAQTYTVTGSIAANLSGTCAVASCTATQATTITITY